MGLLHFLVLVALVIPMSAVAKPSSDAARRTKEAKVKRAVEEIQKSCGIPATAGQFRYEAKGISLIYDGMIENEKLRCAADRAIVLGVGFDTYDTSATYGGPRRFIIKGPAKRLDSVAADALAAHWTITHRANAGDGIGFLEIERPATATRREVREFLDRFIGFGDLSDVAIGLAPTGRELPATATVFRSAASNLYEALNMPSCGLPAGFDREQMIRPDRDSVASLEHALSATNAGGHLAIARADVAYMFSIETHCRTDSDLSWARLRVEKLHKSVGIYSALLRKLAPAVDPLPEHRAPANAAQFRYQVRQLVESSLPLCRWTTKGSNDAVLAASRAQIKALEERLRGTPYAVHLKVAREDADYHQSRRVAECDEPGSAPVAKLSADALAHAKKRVAEIEGLILPR